MKKYIILILSAILLISCEKEININLNKSNPRFVIEGNISNWTSECNVKITKTINFDEVIPNPTVSGAIVTITNVNTNHTDTLKETSAGFYSNDNVVGKEGFTYMLNVKIGTETFIANSTMPVMVSLDSIQQMENSSTHGGPMGGGKNDVIRIVPKYTDPANVANYFQFIVTKKRHFTK